MMAGRKITASQRVPFPILRSVPFLAPHVPIVELHHERPDGREYPYGLTSEQTPLLDIADMAATRHLTIVRS